MVVATSNYNMRKRKEGRIIKNSRRRKKQEERRKEKGEERSTLVATLSTALVTFWSS